MQLLVFPFEVGSVIFLRCGRGERAVNESGRRRRLVRALQKDNCNIASLMTQHQHVPFHMRIREVRDGEIFTLASSFVSWCKGIFTLVPIVWLCHIGLICHT